MQTVKTVEFELNENIYRAVVEMDVWEEKGEDPDGRYTGMETYSEIASITVADLDGNVVEETPEMRMLIDRELAHVDLSDEIHDIRVDDAEEKLSRLGDF